MLLAGCRSVKAFYKQHISVKRHDELTTSLFSSQA